MASRNFLVIVKAYVPYPKEYEVVVKAHDYGTAVGRAWREVRAKHLKGRRLQSLTFIVTNLGADETKRVHREGVQT